MHIATYSPDDNKLRLYPAHRLDADEYARVKAAGFKWAPKQELFVAPMWTPERADLLLEMCGEIGDEDTSLVDRAEERAERFEDYSDSRAADAGAAQEGVRRIADGIPFGQPILVGHHSERHARRDAERIENGMRRAVKMWETSQYWTDRARGAIRHAKYKERPDVRARRIKGLEADRRKCEKNVKVSEASIRLWQKLHQSDSMTRKDGQASTFLERATYVAGNTNYAPNGTYSALVDGKITPEEAQQQAISSAERCIAINQRWIDHIDNRLAYERALLADAGGTAADKTGPEKGGACQCWASPGRGPGMGWSYIAKVNKVTVTVWDNWGNGGKNFTRTIPFDKLIALMTAADVAAARAAGRLIETEDKTGFYLADLKPEPSAVTEEPKNDPRDAVICAECDHKFPNLFELDKHTCPADFEAMRDALRNGSAVKVVSAPQLFPTPPDIARRVVELADIQPGHRVLEPSAGTGALLREIPVADVVCVEINRSLAEELRRIVVDVRCGDFLTLNGELGYFDRIVMNPPFENAADIRHIMHARTHLAPGGRLVAICANGPRQRAKLEPIAREWIDLPSGSFKSSGTDVSAAIVVIDAVESWLPQ